MASDQNVRRSARVERQRLKFAAAHMATFGDTLELLHGHNYAAIIEVEGELSEVGWVADFGVLKRIGREICERLDHQFLLQRASGLLGMRRRGDAWELSFAGKRYRLPADDVFELPITNTTAEQIAEWFWNETLSGLLTAGVQTIKRLAIGIEEAPGQTGWFAADLV